MSLVLSAPSGWSPQASPASPQGWYQGPLAMPEVLSDGTLAETPEVAAARAAHLAALQAAVVANPDNDDGHYDPHKYGDHLYGVVSHAEDLTNSITHYNTLARPQVQASAQAEADFALWKAKEAATVAAGGYSYGAQNKPYSGPQVQASAQAEADLALWKANEAPTVAAGGYAYGAQNKPYSGPLAMLEVLPSGYLADTLEVAAARRTHLSALAEAQAAETLWRAKHSQAETQHRPWN